MKLLEELDEAKLNEGCAGNTDVMINLILGAPLKYHLSLFFS